MNRGIYAAASAMAAAEQRVEAITANLANAGAVGFKRKGVVTHSFQSTLHRKMQPQIASSERTDWTQGSLRSTEGTYDLALEGPGFFAVDTDRGEGYTRNGAFHIDSGGVLQTRAGLPVAWDGPRGTINAEGGAPSVDSQGNVRQDGNEIGRLRLVDFANSGVLTLDREGLLRAPAGAARQASAGTLHQGVLENANVNAIDEMVALISAQRSFESSARTLSTIEQVLRRMTNSR
ncbi:MAG: flagellar hook-basal body protein [Planctomycetota bacterium]